MDSLVKLISNLQPGEIRTLRHFFRMQQNIDRKRDQLFESVLKLKNSRSPGESETRIMNKLYPPGSRRERSYEKLKTRLKTDILNVLLLNESSVKCSSKLETMVCTCKRLILQSEILLRRGLYKEAAGIIEKASDVAQKHELYTEQLLIDNLRTSYNMFKSEEAEYIRYTNKIKTATTLIEKALFAKHFYEELASYSLFRLGEEPPFDEWEKKLTLITQYAEASSSSKVRFYYNICSVYYYRYTRQYERSLDFGLELLKQAESTAALKTTLHTGNVQLEAARCFLLMKQYDSAIYHASRSTSSLESDKRNILSSLEVLFYSNVNTGNYKGALEITDRAFTNSYLSGDSFLCSKWWFLRAGVEFKLNDYRTSIVSLKKCNELYKDKNHWMLACSIFETICRIENGDFDWFEYRSEGLRKIMMRHNRNRKNTHNKRFGIIYQILKTLNRNNFNFSKTLHEEKKNMDLLASGNDTYVWNLAGCEIVRFDEWLREKAGSKTGKEQLVA